MGCFQEPLVSTPVFAAKFSKRADSSLVRLIEAAATVSAMYFVLVTPMMGNVCLAMAHAIAICEIVALRLSAISLMAASNKSSCGNILL
mgnify:CR=1 FL=1